MKRLLGLLLASTLVLGACGSNDTDKKEESKKTTQNSSLKIILVNLYLIV